MDENMNSEDYLRKTKKRPPKTKPRSKPLPKVKEKYLEAEEKFEHALDVLGMKNIQINLSRR